MKRPEEYFADKGKNFMTPIILRYQMVGEDYSAELSKGEGIDHKDIYGVTIIDVNTGKFDKSKCGCFHSRESAERHIWELGKEEQVK